MRTAACSLAALLGAAVAGFGQPVAKLKPMSVSGEGLSYSLGHVKLVEGLTSPNQSRSKTGAKAAQRIEKPLQTRVLLPPETCGHIVTTPAQPGVDRAIIVPIAPNRDDRMPKFKGIPPCQETRR
jgi:hypothetical protein